MTEIEQIIQSIGTINKETHKHELDLFELGMLVKAIEQYVIKARIEELEKFSAPVGSKTDEMYEHDQRIWERIEELKKELES